MRFVAVVLGMLMVLLGVPAYAQAGAATSAATTFPKRFPLPDGFQPEGIAIGRGPWAYFGSRATGAIYRADLRTGKGKVISPAAGKGSLGLKVDRGGRLFVSGGSGGDARVIDLRSGKVIRSYAFTTDASFVNDVVLTSRAAWFTDSTNPVLYRVPLRHGRLPKGFTKVPLKGDIEYGEGINANGIAQTPDGRALLVVQSNTGKLFRVSPVTGVARQVDLRGESLTNGDGLLLIGRTLYVVQNRLNTVAVVRLNHGGTAGRVVDKITDSRFDIPTTVAAFGNRLYLPNARFSTTPTPTTPYDVVAVRRR